MNRYYTRQIDNPLLFEEVLGGIALFIAYRRGALSLGTAALMIVAFDAWKEFASCS